MSLVKSKRTKPELLVKRVIRLLGYKYRSHVKTIPGSPDFVFPHVKKVIFVHGCFWHQHGGCRKDRKPRTPKTKLDYWLKKLINNRNRDLRIQRKLRRMGWRYLIVWECKTKNKQNLGKLPDRIKVFIESN